jgi:hypothetical protein
MEAIAALLRAGANMSTVHVGEVIPEGNTKNYVYMIRAGEQLAEDLNNLIDIDSISVDIECVSNDIDQCRTLTQRVKWLLRGYAQHSVDFLDDFGISRTIHGFMVEDHDDTYIPRALENDDQVHIGAMNVTVLYGGICSVVNKVGPGPGA